MRLKILTIIFLAVPIISNAESIKQRTYTYQFDTVQSLVDDAFIVCSDCMDSELHKMPQQVKLAIRLSGEPRINKPVINKAETVTTKIKTAPTSILAGTVYFEFDSSTLKRSDKTVLDGIAARKAKGIQISGYSCDIGPKQYNHNLSERRAKNVAKYLLSKGLTIQKSEGKGESTSEMDKKLNRKVEVNIEKID